ncbi:AraC family transcriptional regulator [Mycobacterium sp. SMC-4]|uniref:AraC family transcriptional regulator n=1 Tax=Mycobacterium sp. SMC-4 TaxID=2857059 RepID=UPI0021B395B1|nr:AraC family transcriptional regulator [Mycobacterium sp. SMC-4]UXA19402.1 AraC family transcriptional regulator [Mycobacterium sp. SMC-4]
MAEPDDPPLPQTCCPVVWLWPGRALYAGPGLNLRPHSGAVWCLAVGVDGVLTVTADEHRVRARSVLIPPRLVHQLDTHGGRLVSCYLDPSSDRIETIRTQCRSRTGDVRHRHVSEQILASAPADDDGAMRWLDVAAPGAARPIDPRIRSAAARIASDPDGAPSACALAENVGLSESRFLHLFRAQTGTSVRRYRLWIRLMRAGRAMTDGAGLTEAAAQAGFASPSHLSDRFRETFGLTASELLRSGVALRTAAPSALPEPHR